MRIFYVSYRGHEQHILVLCHAQVRYASNLPRQTSSQLLARHRYLQVPIFSDSGPPDVWIPPLGFSSGGRCPTRLLNTVAATVMEQRFVVQFVQGLALYQRYLYLQPGIPPLLCLGTHPFPEIAIHPFPCLDIRPFLWLGTHLLHATRQRAKHQICLLPADVVTLVSYFGGNPLQLAQASDVLRVIRVRIRSGSPAVPAESL